MIYKFKFETYTDDNRLLTSRSEESGDFWKAYIEFTRFLSGYILRYIPHGK
jgi:hypothetical protein